MFAALVMMGGITLIDFGVLRPDPVRLSTLPSDEQIAGGAERDWIDPATGHRVIRLSEMAGTQSFYFHQYPYTDKGDRLVVSTPQGFAAIDLTTLGTAPCKIELITKGKGGGGPIVGKKSRQVFYVKSGGIHATHIDTKVTREIVKLPAGLGGASGLAINADETLLASTGSDPQAKSFAKDDKKLLDHFLPPPGPKGKMTPGGRSMTLFTVNIQTGEIKRVLYSTDWLNHTQFSPTEPEQLLFCHEGTWHELNRVWTIRTDGSRHKLIHARTMMYEIAGHEFFSADGKMVWYDLQTPRSKEFWLAGVNIATGERIRYPIERSHWSVHYNQSPDGKLFAGDGGGPNSVANQTPMPGNKKLSPPANGQWIFLFRPRSEPFDTIKVGDEEVKIGKLEVEKLVDLGKHDYQLEPNGTFTPDGKWVVFRSNMHGATHVYAVEVKGK